MKSPIKTPSNPPNPIRNRQNPPRKSPKSQPFRHFIPHFRRFANQYRRFHRWQQPEKQPKTLKSYRKINVYRHRNPAFNHQFRHFQTTKKAVYIICFTKFTHRNPQTLTAKQESKTDLSAEFNTRFAVRKTENGTFPHKIEDPRLENAVFS